MPFARPIYLLRLIGALRGLAAAGTMTTTRPRRAPPPPPPRHRRELHCDRARDDEPDTLTVATDSPAFPPYFEGRRPDQRRGFESAVAYAIADELGFTRDQVEWSRALQLVLRARAQGLRLRRQPDLDHPEAGRAGRLLLAVLHGQPGDRGPEGLELAAATSLADLADATIRRPDRTTSLDAVNASIQPSSEPQVFDTSNDVVTRSRQAGRRGRRRLPTAFYLDRGPGARGDDRRPVRGARRRPVGRPAREGARRSPLASPARSTRARVRGAGRDRVEWMSEKPTPRFSSSARGLTDRQADAAPSRRARPPAPAAAGDRRRLERCRLGGSPR